MSVRRIGTGTLCSTLALLLGLAAAPSWGAGLAAKARELMEAGDLRGATIELKNVLQKDPNDAEARLLLARLYLRSGQGAAAEKEVLTAIELGVEPRECRLDLVEALILQNKHEAAMQKLEGAADVTDLARAMALKGTASLGLGQSEKAAEYYRRAIETDPANESAALGLVRVQLAENRKDEAIASVDAFLGRFPKNVDALLIRAELHRAEGEIDAANRLLDRALDLDPRSVLGRLARATVLIAAKKLDAARADLAEVEKLQKGVPLVGYLRGVIDFQEKNWKSAGENLDRMLSQVPGHPQSQLLLGIIRYSEGELQTADELLGNALGAMPDNLQAVKVLAATRIKLRKTDAAIALLEPYTRGGDPQMLALLGSAYMLKGDLEKGQEMLNKAVEDAPDVAALRTQLALTMLAGGKTDEAVVELQSAVDLGQDILQADVLLVLAHLKNKRFDEALKASEALEKRKPDSAIPYNLTGLALMAKGDLPAARERFEKSLVIDPKFATAELNLARIEVAAKDLEAAKRRYEKVLETNPQHLGALLGLAALAEQRKEPEALVAALERAQDANPGATQPGLLLTRFYITRGDYLKALSVANDLSSRFPEDESVTQMLARAQTLGGQVPNAVRTFDRLIESNPRDANLRYLAGGARWKALDHRGAQEQFRKALELKPDFVDAQVALASVSLDAGDTETALAAARALESQYPKSPVGYRVEGTIFAAKREPAQAAAAFGKAYAIQRSSAVARQLAEALQQSGKSDEAVKVLKGWVKDSPEDADAQGMLGLFLQQLGKSKEAIVVYESVLGKAQKKSPLLLNNLAWLYQEQGDPRAIGLAKEAYDLAPSRPEVADTYGWILFQNGKREEGLAILQQAYLAFPTQTEIGWHVGVALEALGRQDEAVQILRKVLRTDPGSPQAEEVKKLLAKLGG